MNKPFLIRHTQRGQPQKTPFFFKGKKPMAHPFAAREAHEQAISIAQVNHLPIVADFAQQLGLVATVNQLVPSEMNIELRVVALAMVLDTLSGRSSLSQCARVSRS
jgi:hypothetical protein